MVLNFPPHHQSTTETHKTTSKLIFKSTLSDSSEIIVANNTGDELVCISSPSECGEKRDVNTPQSLLPHCLCTCGICRHFGYHHFPQSLFCILDITDEL